MCSFKNPRFACLPYRYQRILSWQCKHKKANAQALKVLRKSLSKEYLNIVSHCDSASPVQNILTSPELQIQINEEEKSSGEESDQHYFMVQGNDSFEVYSDTN